MPLMTVREVSEFLKVSDSFVYALLQSGRMKHHVLGRGQGGKRVSMEGSSATLLMRGLPVDHCQSCDLRARR